MYSQHDEEKAILEAFHGLAWRTVPDEQPRFLDIGAFHPKVFSNTRALFELGWYGVMFEPSPSPVLSLLEEYGNEPRVTLVMGAVTAEPGLIELQITDDALSTSSEKVYEAWKATAKYRGKVSVPGIPLEYIAHRWGGFDFINIDAEGTSVDLFHGMMKLNWEPRCFCVEHDGRESELIEACSKRYNVVYGNGTNLVMVHK